MPALKMQDAGNLQHCRGCLGLASASWIFFENHQEDDGLRGIEICFDRGNIDTINAFLPVSFSA